MPHTSRLNLRTGLGTAVAILLTIPAAFAQSDAFEGGGGSTSNPYQRGGYSTPTTPTYDPSVQGNRGYKPFQKNPGNDAADKNQQKNSEIVTGQSGEKRGQGIVGKAADAAKKLIKGAGGYTQMVPTLDTPDKPTGPERLPNGAFPLKVKDQQFITGIGGDGPLVGNIPGSPIFDIAKYNYEQHSITWKYKRGGGIKGDTGAGAFVGPFTCRVQEDRALSRPFTYMKGLYTRNANGSGYISELQYSYDGYTYEADNRGKAHYETFTQSYY